MTPFRWTFGLALAAALASCGGGAGEEPADASPAAQLFRSAKCESCHGPEGGGLPRVGPALAALDQHWKREELAQYLLDPAPFRASKPHLKEKSREFFAHMRPFPELSPEERDVLAGWLLERF